MTKYKYTRWEIYQWLTEQNWRCQELIDMLLEREKVKKSRKSKKSYDVENLFPGITESLNRLTIVKK